MPEIDERIVTLGIEVNGVLKTYNGLSMTARGTKYANPIQNECTVTIANLDEDTRNYILTETSPYNKNKTPKRFIVSAGRKSTGVVQMFIGDIVKATISQPPDIKITIKSLTNNHKNGKIVSNSLGGRVSLSNVAKQTADDAGLPLKFEALDKQIANYSYTGSAGHQVGKLGEAGQVDAYVDDGVLVVKDRSVPLSGIVRELNLETGMIGIPEFTEHGIRVSFLIDNHTKLGSALKITSKLNPSVNGTYVIYKLGFDITSRDTPFYYSAECVRYNG